ncbi:folate family ECF transporter S component [Ruminococcaceae bacterium OttesenSCG-928-A16]|nr:folate family ECF transporter S component [Ruminococcaceae bacterium OttesenSCG-928-A16]
MQETKKIGFVAYWRSAASQVKQVRTLAGAGLLAALGTALKFLIIPLSQVLRINFAFLSTALAGYMYGPIVAGLVAAVADILGFLVGPPTGPYSPAFTVVAFVGGFLYGCWLYKKPVRLWRSFCAHATYIGVVSFLLNPLLLKWMYGNAYTGLVLARIPLNAVMLPLGTLLIYLLQKVVERQPGLLPNA